MAFALVQNGSTASGTGSVSPALTAGSTAGTLLVVTLHNSNGASFTGPAGWLSAAGTGYGTTSRTSVWYYPGNPGGITTATFTSSGNCRGSMSEWSTAAGKSQALDSTGTAGGAGPLTSFGATAGSSSAAGDLGIVAAEDSFSVNPASQSWTAPAGYTLLRSVANGAANIWASYYQTGLSAGVQSATVTYSSSASQVGWTIVIATFTEVTPSALAVATTSLPAGQAGVAYQAGLAASNGVPPYAWAVTVGTLPTGLALTSSGGRGGLIGVTPYVAGETSDQTIAGFAALVGRTPTARKVYFQASVFPTTAGAPLQSCLDNNLTAYLCYQPAYNPPTTADYNGLQASLQAFKNLGVKAKVILWQEVEHTAVSAAQYKALLTFYEPAVHAVYPGGLCHDASGWNNTLWASYFPGALGIVDEYGIDYYGDAFSFGKLITPYAALAAGTGKPLSVLEMGSVAAGSGITVPPPPDAVVTAYLNHVTSVCAANPTAATLWYERQGYNDITSADDFRIPLLQQLFDTVTGNAAGAISGTPTGSGLSSFTVRVTDNNAATATAALSINITAPGLPVITTTSLPAATAGSPYSQALAVTGGTAPCTWAVTTGAVPAGLALDPALGVITGTPTALAATSGFTVTVTDANSKTDSQSLFITVVAAPPPPVPAGAPPPGWPQIIIEAGLAPAAPQVPAGTFILDDPVYGKLDTGILADTTAWTDITALTRSGTTARTSTRMQGPLLAYQAATGAVVLKNADGRFDPDNPSSPYAGYLRAMVPFRARAVYGGIAYPIISVFTDSWGTPGTNWGPNYTETTVSGTDGFKVLAGVTIPAIPPGDQGIGAGDGEDSGARVTRILNAAGWYTDHRRVSVGDSAVQGTLFGDTALNLLQLTADSEIGELYIDASGNVVFRHRHAILTETRSTQVQAIFGDLPGTAHGGLTELPYVAVSRANDDTQLANDIQATSLGGTLQEAQDMASQRTYLFPRTYARPDLLLDDDPSTLAWAQWVLTVSLSSDDRFDTLTVTPLREPLLWPQVLGREIGDLIQVIRRPPGVAAITQNVFIRGITHIFDVSSNTWQTTWDLQSAARYTGFLILDDPVNGKLDTGKLAF